MSLEEIVQAIQKHEDEHPDHGVGCACMDGYVQQVRKMTAVENVQAQRRIDAVLHQAIMWRR